MQSHHLVAASLFALCALSCTSQEGPREVPESSAADSNVAADSGEVAVPTKDEGPWEAGDLIASGLPSGQNIEILEVHANGEGDVAGNGKMAELKYVAMLADGTVLDPGRRPFSFRVGTGNAIQGWHRIVSKMRVGDSFTLMIPQDLCYGPSKGDLKFDMELLSLK